MGNWEDLRHFMGNNWFRHRLSQGSPILSGFIFIDFTYENQKNVVFLPNFESCFYPQQS
jgi:hypothetical protein